MCATSWQNLGTGKHLRIPARVGRCAAKERCPWWCQCHHNPCVHLRHEWQWVMMWDWHKMSMARTSFMWSPLLCLMMHLGEILYCIMFSAFHCRLLLELVVPNVLLQKLLYCCFLMVAIFKVLQAGYCINFEPCLLNFYLSLNELKPKVDCGACMNHCKSMWIRVLKASLTPPHNHSWEYVEISNVILSNRQLLRADMQPPVFLSDCVWIWGTVRRSFQRGREDRNASWRGWSSGDKIMVGRLRKTDVFAVSDWVTSDWAWPKVWNLNYICMYICGKFIICITIIVTTVRIVYDGNDV